MQFSFLVHVPVPQRDMQYMLGHATTHSTLIYIHDVIDENLQPIGYILLYSQNVWWRNWSEFA